MGAAFCHEPLFIYLLNTIKRVPGKSFFCLRLLIAFFRDLNMLSDSENPQHLELHEPVKAGER